MVRGGYIPSGFDGRDAQWPDAPSDETAATVWLPRPALWDQGTEVDSCTACAVASAMEMLDLQDQRSRRLSPLFLYYFSRSSPYSLGRVPLRTALRVASKRGICRYELHPVPFTSEGALTPPRPEARQDARRHRLVAYDPATRMVGYYSIHTGDRIARWRAALRQGQPIVVGFWTQESYWQGAGMMDSEVAPHRGAHAAVVAGFDDAKQAFRVVDSRGVAFAEEGEWDLGYLVARTERVVESWTVRTLSYEEDS